MEKYSHFFISVLLLTLLIGAFLVSCGSTNSTPSSASGNDGASLVQNRCSVCHSLTRVTSAHKTAAEWTTTVERMVSHGAQLSSQERQTLIDYLAVNYK